MITGAELPPVKLGFYFQASPRVLDFTQRQTEAGPLDCVACECIVGTNSNRWLISSMTWLKRLSAADVFKAFWLVCCETVLIMHLMPAPRDAAARKNTEAAG